MTKNIYQKLIEAKSTMEGFVKDTKGYNYKYVSGSQVLHKLNPELSKHGLFITLKTSNEKLEMFEDKKGKQQFLVTLDMHYTIIDADTPESFIDSKIFATGTQDDPSKALGTALTYSERYFLMKFFGIPTDEDDADAKQKKQQYAPKKAADANDIKELQKLLDEALKFGGDDGTEEKLLRWLTIEDKTRVFKEDLPTYLDKLTAFIDAKKKLNKEEK